MMIACLPFTIATSQFGPCCCSSHRYLWGVSEDKAQAGDEGGLGESLSQSWQLSTMLPY